MNVLYDISILGRGFYDKGNRAGVFRVIENVARSLVEGGDCTLSFCATASVTDLIQSAKYRERTPGFSGVPLLASGGIAPRKVLDGLSSLYPLPEENRGEGGLYSLARCVAKRMGLLAPGLNTRMLQGKDIFHSTFFPLPPPSPGASPRRFITVYDLIPIFHPEYFEGNTGHILHQVVKSIGPEDFVLTISASTKNDLCSYAGVDPARVFVTPLAASDNFYQCDDPVKLSAVRRQYGLPDAPYLLSLSTLEPRKNIVQTIRCFTRFVEESGDTELHLVLVGGKGWDYAGIFDEIKARQAVRRRIIVTGYVADNDLAVVYSGALLFVYPSLYEGFGLPPLEAMQCGVPVITSNSSSLPEVVGDAGIMVNPRDADALCQAIALLVSDSSKREELSRRSLERAKAFSWKRCADLTVQAYHAAVTS